MRWTDAQRTLLREMGLRLWLPGASVELEPATGPTGRPGLVAAPEGTAPTPLPAKAAVWAPKPAPAAVVAAVAAAGSPHPAAAEATLALDWPGLRAAVASCEACGLCESRRQTVFGVGHLRAHCMIVGGAPNEQEDAEGEPLVGEPGQLLDRMLRALGLSREPAQPGAQEGELANPARQVFIADALKCRPPRSRNPTPLELSSCRPFLERQVALVQPRVILAMGPLAVLTLLGSNAPVGTLRGRLHHWRGVPVVVTYHPAYLLNHLADKAGAWEDLCLAASCLDTVPG